MHANCKIPRPLALALLFLLGLTASFACQVPVFRYALERWESDFYTVLISPAAADGEISAAEKEVVELLESAQSDPATGANIFVRIDDQAKAEHRGKMRLFYPQKIRGLEPAPIWTGAISAENAQKIVHSPARREIVERILSGQSAIWLLVRSGNPEKDQTALKELEAFATEAKDVLDIPEGVVTQEEALEGDFRGNPDNILRAEVPLKIEFTSLTVSRDDPAEEVFLAMLTNLEDDLHEYENEPMVFPVFGRGRVLEPLIAAGINRDNALDYSGYLCGACSCEVKDQNPGMDLVVSANWDEALDGNTVVIDKILPPLSGTAAITNAVTPNAGLAAAEPEEVVSSGSVEPAALPIASTEPKGSASKGPLLKPHFPEKKAAAESEENTVIADSSPGGISKPLLITGGAVGGAVLLIALGTILMKRRES